MQQCPSSAVPQSGRQGCLSPTTFFAWPAMPTRNKQAAFDLLGLSAGINRTFILPNLSATIAHLGNAEHTFTGSTTFSTAAVKIGTSTFTATYGIGTGGMTPGVTRTLNLGTGGAAKSTTVIDLGSTTAGTLYPAPQSQPKGLR